MCPWDTEGFYPGLAAREDACPPAAHSLHTATHLSHFQRFSKINTLRRACWVGFYNICFLGTEGQGPKRPASVIILVPALCQLYFMALIP